jgi:putative ABC transport system permease protein
MSLALSTLIYEWRRYFAAVVALSCAGILILSMSGFLVGILAGYTATIDRSRADIMVLMPEARSLMNSGGIPARIMPLVYMHPAVIEVRDLAGDGGRFAVEGKPDPTYVNISIVDAIPEAVTLPTDFSDDIRDALAVPYNVAVDRTALRRLGVRLGDEATLDGRMIRIGAVLDGYPNLDGVNVIMSRQTMRLIRTDRGGGAFLGPLMIKVANPREAERVRDELNTLADGQYRAWTREELSEATFKQFMNQGILAVLMGFLTVLGFFIGLAITSQTLRGAILANIKELASLRALGVSMRSLRLVVIEMSFWVGVAGLVMTAGLMVLISFAASVAGIPMLFQPSVIVTIILLLMTISIFSGLLTLGVLKKSQPADLLR